MTSVYGVRQTKGRSLIDRPFGLSTVDALGYAARPQL